MREPTMIAAVGMPGVGKTFQNLIQIRDVYLGNPAKGVPPRKILIIDNNNEYRNDNRDAITILGPHRIHIKTIHPKQVHNFSASRVIEVCRIIPFTDRGEPMSLQEFADTLNIVLTRYRGGLLIAEDFKAYTGNSLNEELIGKLATRRHSGCDTIVSLQGMGMIVPSLWMNLKWLRMHKTQDPLQRSDGKFSGQIHFLTIAERIVNRRYQNGDERFYVFVDLLRGAIYGNYTHEEFLLACEAYLYENWAKTGGILLKHLDRDTGKAKYTKPQAIKQYLDELTREHSRFSPRFKK